MDLQAIAPIIQEILIQSLQEKRYPFGFAKYKGLGDKVASGKLKNSINVQVNESQEQTTIQVIAEDYFQWVQSGRLPGKKGVPIESIEQWIRERKLKGRDKKGKFIKNRNFAFAIQKNIKKFGIRPSNFLDVAIDKLQGDQRILDIIGNSTFEELLNTIEGI
jgi:hypothetical protein